MGPCVLLGSLIKTREVLAQPQILLCEYMGANMTAVNTRTGCILKLISTAFRVHALEMTERLVNLSLLSHQL